MTSRADADRAFDALVDAFLARLRAGEALDADALARAHPEHAERIRAVVPVLALVERLKSSAAAPAATAPPPAATGGRPPDLPERLGRWRIGREIGRGGMGRVLEAVDDAGRRAAVKVVHPHLLTLPGIVERFLREADAGRRLDHPLVVRTLDAGRAEILGRETPWIALEHVEGRNLRQVLDETGGLSERLARAIGHGVAEALAAVHAAGLVHRDVKPENVVITPREEVRLMDLGLALVRDAGVRLSGTGDFVGTLLYAAPEQLAGLPVSPATDLHALGLLLYELVCGRHPCAGGAGAPPPLGAAPPPLRGVADVSPFYEALVNGLLEREPARRLGPAGHVAALLRDGESSAWWRAQEAGRRHARRPRVDRGVPLVGRATEMAHLEDAWASALRGEGRVVLVEGESGLGKSRLVHEWLDRVEQSGVSGLRTAVADHARDVADAPLLPLSAALRDVLGAVDVAARLAVLLDEGRPLVPAFADHLLGRAVPGGPELSEASRVTAHRLLLRGLAREGPVVLVAEDLDEATEASQRLFLALARAAEHERVVLVATASPGLPRETLESLRVLPHAQVVGLDPLGRDDAHELFLRVVGGAPSTAPWHDAVQGAGGNPLCLIEWARAARGASAESVPLAVPDALRTVVERRVASLDPESAHVLAVAACAGERFDPSVVSAAAGTGRLEGLRRLHRLDRDDRLVAADGDAYRFRHALVRGVVHDDLPPALRAEIHGAIARALEGTSPGPSPGARAAAIVHHALRGTRPHDALPHARAAIAFLWTTQRPREEAALCEALLALGDALDRPTEALAVIHLGASRLRFTPPDVAIPPLERGLALARDLGDDDLTCAAALPLIRALSDSGRLEQALEVQRVAQACATRSGAVHARAEAAISHYEILYEMGRLSEAGEAATVAAALADTVGDPWLKATAAYYVGVTRVEFGDTVGARPGLEAAVRTARALGDRSLETSVVTALSKADFVEGRLDSAREHLDRLIAIAREQGELRPEIITRSNLVSLEIALGRLHEARETARLALTSAQRAGYPSVAGHAGIALAWAEWLLGAWGCAADTLDQAMACSAVLGSPLLEAKIAARRLVLLAWAGCFEEAEALHAAYAPAVEEEGAVRERLALDDGLAEVHTARGDPAAAALVWERVLAEAAPLHLELDAARRELAIGVARRDLGQSDEARHRLEVARDAADRMGMRGLAALARVHLATLPGADRTLGRVALTEHAEAMGVHPRMRATVALARATGDPALWRLAAADLEALRASVPASRRDALVARVPLHRDLSEAVRRA